MANAGASVGIPEAVRASLRRLGAGGIARPDWAGMLDALAGGVRRRLVLLVPCGLGTGIGVYFALPSEPPLAAGLGALVLSGLLALLLRRRPRALGFAALLLAVAVGFLAAELEALREKAKAEGKPWAYYTSHWRDRDPAEAPKGAFETVWPVIRLRAPRTGETTVEDKVQGPVTVQNDQLDDMVLLRADGTPVYMLSVVVDDIDMGITQIIRGDDHLTNTFRQVQLYNAIGATPPDFAHIPLIHGPDGAKLSKRHGALGIEAYRDMGYLPAALRNYLLRLGWGHGDEEVIPTEKAIEWFDLDGVGRSPSRLDFAKLENLNGIYMRETPDAELLERITPSLETALGRSLVDADRAILLLAMTGLKQRAKTLVELADSALFYLRSGPLPINEAALEAEVNRLAEAEGLKLGKVAQPLRAALTGSNVSPGIFEVAAILGRDETLRRIRDVAGAS